AEEPIRRRCERRTREPSFAKLICQAYNQRPVVLLDGSRRVRSEARAPVANRGMITASIMLATIMQGVDNTIANVALPHIQGSLSAAQDQIAWVLTSYIVAVAIMTPLTGWL